MTTDVRVPRSLAALGPDWFTEHLGTAVQSVSMAPVAVASAAGSLARAELSYPEEGSGPRFVILKGRGDSENQRRMESALGLSAREQLFYSRIADAIPVAAPRCYFVGEVGGAEPVVLEDLAHLRAGDQVAGLSMTDALRLIDDLALLHARYWETEPPGGDPDRLISWTDPTIAGMITMLVCSGVDNLRARYSGRVRDQLLDAVAAAAPEWHKVLARCAEGPHTFVHNDFRLDNIFFAPDGCPVVIDWQLAGRCRGTQDVAYLLSGSMTEDMLRASWPDLLSRYHAALVSNGVRDYSFDQCLWDYRQSLLYTIAPGIAMLGQMQLAADERGLADALVLRTLVHADELDAFGTL
jgi:Phosphotransferase enzyme family